jgi:uroporphyrin-III C-methyltransferase/precorrin-2 dehydrogenase/sirohydrochlorin ferrochelatase
VAGVQIGVLSEGGPDPRRAARIRDDLAAQLREGRIDPRPVRAGASGPDVLRPGQVALVGGGPGDPALMTVRARTLLAQADVVVADRLGPAAVLDELGEDVEVIGVGKTPGVASLSQRGIEQVLVDRARAGHRVVRLKGGDPFLYGRGGEEVLACRAAGVPVTVVPGVTSAVAAAEAAGIPVTHRGTSDRLHVVNGHWPFTDLDLAAMRRPDVTVAVLMGVATLADLVAQALAGGVDPDLPAAVVARATLPGERVLRAPLAQIAQRCAAAGVRSPGVVVLGEVAREGFLDPAHPGRAVALPSREERRATAGTRG